MQRSGAAECRANATIPLAERCWRVAASVSRRLAASDAPSTAQRCPPERAAHQRRGHVDPVRPPTAGPSTPRPHRAAPPAAARAPPAAAPCVSAPSASRSTLATHRIVADEEIQTAPIEALGDCPCPRRQQRARSRGPPAETGRVEHGPTAASRQLGRHAPRRRRERHELTIVIVRVVLAVQRRDRAHVNVACRRRRRLVRRRHEAQARPRRWWLRKRAGARQTRRLLIEVGESIFSQADAAAGADRLRDPRSRCAHGDRRQAQRTQASDTNTQITGVAMCDRTRNARLCCPGRCSTDDGPSIHV